MQKRKLKNIHLSKLITFFIIIAFVLAIGKLIYISLARNIDGIDLKEYAEKRNTTKKILYAHRGTIYDSSGNYLATTVNSYTLIAYLSASRTINPSKPQHVVDKETTAKKLSELFIENGYKDMTYDYILERLNSTNKYQVEFAYAKDITETLKLEIEKLDLPGLDFVVSSKRYYQMGDFASYIVGYSRKNADGDITGEMGIEKYYNDELKGENGFSEYQTDNYGYKLPYAEENLKKASSGDDIYLTIDNNIQLFVEQEINTLAKNYKFNWLTLNVADAKTGAILASGASPSFDANKLNMKSYLNPLVSYAYEPGSTMKIFSFMAAIDNDLYDGEETYMSGTIPVSDATIKDFNNVGWGRITFDEGFNYSSNVAATILSQRLGKEKLEEAYTKFGFGSKTGITLPDEANGSIKFNYATEIATAAFGQGITTTPIQNIQALTTIANDGVMIKPYIISKIVDSNTKEVKYVGKREELGQVVKKTTTDKMKEMMHNVVVSGKTDARLFRSDLVDIIGKSGTAQIANPNGGGYLTGTYDYVRSFAMLFPYDDPKYIIYFSVKQFEGSYKEAAKAVVNVVNEIAKYKNLEQKLENTVSNNIITLDNFVNTDVVSTEEKLKSLGLNPVILGTGSVVTKQYPNKNNTVMVNSKVFIKTNSNYTLPNVIGYTKNEIIALCTILNINYELNGNGKVKNTSIPAGSPITTDKITFDLE